MGPGDYVTGPKIKNKIKLKNWKMTLSGTTSYYLQNKS
jgi:hypothetical protein